MGFTGLHHMHWTKKPFRYVIFPAIAVSACAWLGCGRGGRDVELAPVSGKVTYRGEPLPHGQIVMVHDSGQMGASEIQPDGSYQLDAAVGENRLMIQCTDEPNLSNVSPKSGRALRLPKSLIPAKYTDYTSSGLTFDVVDGPNQKDWILSD